MILYGFNDNSLFGAGHGEGFKWGKDGRVVYERISKRKLLTRKRKNKQIKIRYNKL